MEMQDIISIIIPIYNVKEYLDRCILSVINQTYTNLEIILVDDGSTDGSSAVCDKYASMDKRIVVIHKENGGLVSARKAGIEKSQGNFIGFVDGDDYISEVMYEELMEKQKQSSADCVHSGYIVNSYKKIPEKICFEKNMYDSVQMISDYIFSDIDAYRISASIWSKLFRSEVIKKIYNKVSDSDSYGEDLICLICCLCEKISIVSLEDAFYFYTVREKSISNVASGVYGFQKEISLYESLQDVLKSYHIIDKLQLKLDKHIQRQMAYCLRNIYKEKIYVQRYTFSNKPLVLNSNVVIYGAGEVGQDYYSELSRMEGCNIVAWVDKNYKEIEMLCRKIEPIDILDDLDFDYLIIAISNKRLMDKIEEQLTERGVDKTKIINCLPVLL